MKFEEPNRMDIDLEKISETPGKTVKMFNKNNDLTMTKKSLKVAIDSINKEIENNQSPNSETKMKRKKNFDASSR